MKAVNWVLLEMFMLALVVGPRVACAANSVCLHLPEDFFIMDMMTTVIENFDKWSSWEEGLYLSIIIYSLNAISFILLTSLI